VPPQLTVTEGLAYHTLRLSVALAYVRVSTGTGFFYKFVIGEKYFVGLVTCRHVFEGGVSVRFHITRAEGDGLGTVHDVIDLINMQSYLCAHPDASVDLAVMPLYPLFDALDRALRGDLRSGGGRGLETRAQPGRTFAERKATMARGRVGGVP
jgi:hypothetical protein